MASLGQYQQMAELTLRSHGMIEGMFLLRDKGSGGLSYVISVVHGGRYVESVSSFSLIQILLLNSVPCGASVAGFTMFSCREKL